MATFDKVNCKQAANKSRNVHGKYVHFKFKNIDPEVYIYTKGLDMQNHQKFHFTKKPDIEIKTDLKMCQFHASNHHYIRCGNFIS